MQYNNMLTIYCLTQDAIHVYVHTHICSLIRLPSNSIVLILKSIPIVVINDGVNESSLKRNNKHDLPTRQSYGLHTCYVSNGSMQVLPYSINNIFIEVYSYVCLLMC